MTIRTIVADCDDTLLDDAKRLSPYTLRTLREAHDRGVRVILASGRAAVSVAHFIRQLDFGDPYIACNGASIIDGRTHEAMDELFFTVPEARECARFYQDCHMYAQFYLGDYFYYSDGAPHHIAYSQSSMMTGVYAGDLVQAIRAPISKLLGIDTPGNIAAAYEKALIRFRGKASVMISKPIYLEMNPRGATKGEALERLSRLIAIDPATTMAFGDSLNDIPMLKWASYGVAVANARDEVKACARFTCPSNAEDGVARMIARYILEEGEAV
ncbi:MAG: Cof-type HAD-IIB family hydrolase [Clostridia bacterium]|nr:Cof-type HAD-IIB family hydrolase [Clostridia bacterium]